MRHLKLVHYMPKHIKLGMIHGGFVPHHMHHMKKHLMSGRGSGHQQLLENDFDSMSMEEKGEGIKRKRHLKPLTFRR